MMLELYKTMFPELSHKKWVNVDLNKCAKGIVTNLFNPLLDLHLQDTFIKEVSLWNKADYTYGGYMEDRSTLWRGHYHNPEEMIHLGIDFNVPAGTEVCLPFSGRLVHTMLDKDQNGGWGGRLVFYNDKHNFYFIIGHLNELTELHTKDIWYSRHSHIGYVGDSTVNGGWYPHVHLQCVSAEVYEAAGDPMNIDGYGKKGLELSYPNPEEVFISLQN